MSMEARIIFEPAEPGNDTFYDGECGVKEECQNEDLSLEVQEVGKESG